MKKWEFSIVTNPDTLEIQRNGGYRIYIPMDNLHEFISDLQQEEEKYRNTKIKKQKIIELVGRLNGIKSQISRYEFEAAELQLQITSLESVL